MVVAQTTATIDWVLVDLGTFPDLFPLLWFFYGVASMASKDEELLKMYKFVQARNLEQAESEFDPGPPDSRF